MRDAICVLGAVLAVAGLAAGCAAAPRARLLSGSASAADDAPPPPATPATPISPAPPAAPAAQPMPPNAMPPYEPPLYSGPYPQQSPYAQSPCAPPPCAPPPCWSGCGLPCEANLQDWRVRGLFGPSFWTGTDAGDQCGYGGADIGHTLPCSCWGVDGFYRTHTAQFPRDPGGKDGGTWNAVGVKATYERSFNGTRWFWWVGAGPEYFWTTDYLHNDEGIAGYGEAGIGYILNRNVKIRAGASVEAFYTDAARKNPADDGKDRWLFMFAPIIALEIDF